MNIILTGMRGAGKSTVGKILAKKLNKNFLDLDKILEKKLGMKISKIIEKHGWNYFREQESIIAKNLDVDNAVIATGGGVILKKENVNALKKNAIFIFLSASSGILYSRIKDNINRPLLSKNKNMKDELKDILSQRKMLYENTADISVTTDKLNENQVVDKIFKKLKGLCVIIGDPVEHSLSPKMHNAAYKALGIDDKFNYVKCNIKVSELRDFIKDARKLNIRGICCTIPHKVEVIKYLDKVDEVAKKIGAVNTVVNDDGALKGYNTDWIGILAPLEKLTALKDKKVVILGAGGAARAAAFAVTKKGASLIIYNRTLEKAQELAKKFGGKALSMEKLESVKNADIIINATSIGLHPNENKSPLPKNLIFKKHIIFDIVYSTKDTKFIRDAKAKGAKSISGIEMLLHQGFEQFKLFTGLNAPEEIMRKAIL